MPKTVQNIHPSIITNSSEPRKECLAGSLALQQLEPLPQRVGEGFWEGLDVGQKNVQGERVAVEVTVEYELAVDVARFFGLQDRRVSLFIQN